MLGLSRGSVLAVACDSMGGVGPKKHDSLSVPGSVVGRYATRTVLLELICAGAAVSALTVSMGVEYHPTGEQILAGCRAALTETGRRVPVIWSSEKNFAVSATGVGVSAFGLARPRSIRIGRSRRGDEVALVGRPSVGRAVLDVERRGLIPTIRQTMLLMKSALVHEAIPVGSTGVRHEAGVMAKDSGLEFEPSAPDAELDLSAGPSTALLLSVPAGSLSRIERRLDAPLAVIGSLKRATRNA